ncbi:relaxase/mobilization nuclease domain-containing protein [Microbulbifer sp. S227A]|uniref:relaxase/mobilization nuclease domain-containing protein n=1 Tax=Microbulbifer sp. S227A TaxID=3415131 RepID=UPI003C7D048D
MILKGSQRSCGLKLAAHLMNTHDNDHVEVHELRGFTADDLHGAFQEADAIAKGTKCQQYLFSLSLSPPETERVSVADFEKAIAQAEDRLGLTGQSRAIVFHEKEGRRHAHVVWSRIDIDQMKAINLPFYKTRLNEVSKDLFLEHGWRLPDGYRDRKQRDPRNFTLAEWQQAKRQGKDARDIKRTFQEAWSVSDTKDAFAHALEEKGYVLARGDRRGFVAVDVHGEVYAIPKWTGLKTKQVKEKLGDPKVLRSVEEAKAHIAQNMQHALSRWQTDLAEKQRALKSKQDQQRMQLVQKQRQARYQLEKKLEQRRLLEAKQRQERFRTGLKGLWDRVRGEHRQIKEQNEQEAWQAHLRDQKIKDDMVFRNLEERRHLKRAHSVERSALKDQARDLAQDRERFNELRNSRNTRPRDGPSFER